MRQEMPLLVEVVVVVALCAPNSLHLSHQILLHLFLLVTVRKGLDVMCSTRCAPMVWCPGLSACEAQLPPSEVLPCLLI